MKQLANQPARQKVRRFPGSKRESRKAAILRKIGRGLRWGLPFLLAAALLLWGGQALLGIGEIRVVGLQELQPREIIQAAGVREGENLLLVSGDRIARRLAQLPLVEAVEVKKIYFPPVLEISVKERKTAAVVLVGGGCWAADRQGIVFSRRDSMEQGMPVVTGLEEEPTPGRPLPDPKQAEALRLFLEALEQVPGLDVSELNLADPDNLLLFTVEGWQVLLGNSSAMKEKLVLLYESLPYLDPEEEGYIDVRAEDRLVFVPAGGQS